MNPRRHARLSRFQLVISCAALVAVFAGCSRESQDEAATDASPAAAPSQTTTIEPIEGMKYFVGGPIMKPDRYGRLRLAGFNGEVAMPTSRGLLIGYKRLPDGKHFEYRTWLNGRAVAKATGFIDDDGLLWFTERETYDADGDVIARQSFVYHDDTETMTSTVEQYDGDTGELLRKHVQDMPYRPADDDDEDEEDEGGSQANEEG